MANFLKYVDQGHYFITDSTTQQLASSFIHRSVTGFVIQGGGYIGTVDPADPNKQNVKPTQVLPFAAIQNEPGISNKRGTIAMAKLAGDPNSVGLLPGTTRASNGFFVGGYGSVLDQLFSRNFPNYSAGFNLTIPLRNRAAQAQVINDELEAALASMRAILSPLFA